MKTLSLETSSDICSVAILEDNTLVKKIELKNGLTHSETLMPLIDQILEKTSLHLSDINLLVCDIGPGSFTGIRIGVATVKAFSDSLHISAVGISSLESLAYLVQTDGIICSLLDCKNNNCYYALYELKNNIYTVLESAKADSVENCLNFLSYKYTSSPIIFVGDGAVIYKDNIEKASSNFILWSNHKTITTAMHNIDTDVNMIDVYYLGIAGIKKYKKYGEDINILPLYLKKPQAQRQLEIKNILIEPLQFSDLQDLDISDFDNFWNIDLLKQELKSDYSKFICAKLENTIVGFAGIKIIVDEAEIMNIAVKENYRRQGIATLLLNSLINICTENEIKTIHLEVNEENYSALSLYKKLGFEECGRRKNYYQNTYDAILMKREIERD